MVVVFCCFAGLKSTEQLLVFIIYLFVKLRLMKTNTEIINIKIKLELRCFGKEEQLIKPTTKMNSNTT